MEVTRLNFKEVLPIISGAIENSSFIAIDAEFSGLTVRRRENALDTCKERYQKLINGVRDFTIMQFGICTFSWDDEQQQYLAKPFNFYIFPKPYNRQMPDTRFLCQSSSLDFLAGQGFDFNKWIYHGIPFLLPSDEEKLRRTVGNYQKPTPTNGTPSTPNTEEPIPVPPVFEKTIELIMKKVEKFVEDPEQQSLSLPPSSPFVRKLVYSSVKTTHKTGLHLESKTNEDNDKYIVIKKCSEEEKKELENEKLNQEQVGVEQAVGFSKVIRLLAQSGKVLLGHNMLLDLLHTVKLFVSPLPNDIDGFKALAKGLFPRLIDTKVMASTSPLQEHFSLSHLEEVYKKCAEAPFVKPNVLFPEGFEDYLDTSKSHEAGYDAYMTGVAFIAMASYLEKIQDGSSPCGEMDIEIIKPFLNKIFLFPRMEDIPYLNLGGEDPVPSRDHVFHLEHPESWQFSDIQKLFKDFGYIYITKIDETASFVSVSKRERAPNVMPRLDKAGVPYRIMKYSRFYGIDDTTTTSVGNDANSGKDGIDGHHLTPQQFPKKRSLETPTKTPEELGSSKQSKDNVSSSDVEEGELPDSPEPAKKKLKGEHTFFEEPDDW
ncbi:poly(A)-specific ribonuclease PARN-like [Dendronephthya gigantea]|uniref:poly(A)-specific ribonuclease PARN-like n=1 Tax=Dendronephthya gigantea TaxID=151771 RepID=UPI00106A8B97|nr:poly(A)-specific ribonuclease PARN-like [Dendronephthya gigantea]